LAFWEAGLLKASGLAEKVPKKSQKIVNTLSPFVRFWRNAALARINGTKRARYKIGGP